MGLGKSQTEVEVRSHHRVRLERKGQRLGLGMKAEAVTPPPSLTHIPPVTHIRPLTHISLIIVNYIELYLIILNSI